MTRDRIPLAELKAQLLRVEVPGRSRRIVDSLGEAQGVMFLCPKCFSRNGGPVGTHSVICWSGSRGTPPDESPGPGRWKLDGTGIADLTLNADPPYSGSRSVLLTSGCGWHGFVTDGFAHGDLE